MFTKVKEEVEAPVVEITAKEAKRAAINDARNASTHTGQKSRH